MSRSGNAGVLLLLAAVTSLGGLSAAPASQSGSVPGATTPAAQTGATGELPQGKIVDSVVTRAVPEQSYALYLPSYYTVEGSWPLLLCFDPGARGKVPVELFQPAAEKYGYIVVSSNNSRNGPIYDQMEAFRHVWNDVLMRFPIDTRRVYTAGFSGGARAASLAAHLCPRCIAGVIASGAGFSAEVPISRKISFAYFSAVGFYDFNYAELVDLHRTLDELAIPNRMRVFDGAHQWAPAEILAEGIEWMELRAMAARKRPRDQIFIETLWSKALERARAYEEEGDVLAAFRTYRAAAADFHGLTDVSRAEARVEELNHSSELRQALREQRRQVKRHWELRNALVGAMRELREAPESRATNVRRLRARIAELRARHEKESRPEEVAILRRALGSALAAYYEHGELLLREGNHSLAAIFFEIATEVRPESAFLEYKMAQALSLAGEKEEALTALGRAVEKGFSDIGELSRNPAFTHLRDSAEFREVIEAVSRQQTSNGPQPK